jgi:hypothetical protein
VLLYLFTRPWDADVGSNYIPAVESFVRRTMPHLEDSHVRLMLSRVRIISLVPQVRARASRLSA